MRISTGQSPHPINNVHHIPPTLPQLRCALGRMAFLSLPCMVSLAVSFSVPSASHRPPLNRSAIIGWSLLDNVILMNGTLFIVANDRTKLPPLDKMFSTGVPMESEPATWRGRGTTDREMQVVNQEAARTLFGNFGSRIQGTTFLCNDAPQCAC